MKTHILDLLILAIQLTGFILIFYAVARISPVAATALCGAFLIWFGSVLYRSSREDDGKGGKPE